MAASRVRDYVKLGVLAVSAMLASSAAPAGTRASGQATGSSSPLLAIGRVSGKPKLTVKSAAFVNGGRLPGKYSDYEQKFSPPLEWQQAPAETKAIAVVMEDPDAKEPRPFVHWLLYNVPSSVTGLPEAVPNSPRLPEVGGALQGRNSRGSIGYTGPHPPPPDPPHHYHFEVFALDGPLQLDPMAAREQLLDAMVPHVLAAGEIVAIYRKGP